MLNSFNWWWDGGVLLFSLFLESVLSLILLGSFLEDLSIFNWDVNVEGLHIYAGHAFCQSCSLLLVCQQICLNSSYEKKWLFKEEWLELFLRLSLFCGQRKPHKTRTAMRPIISGIDSAHNVFFSQENSLFLRSRCIIFFHLCCKHSWICQYWHYNWGHMHVFQKMVKF